MQVKATSATGTTVTVPVTATAAGNLLAVYLDWNNTGTVTISDNKSDGFTSVAAPVVWNNSTSKSQVFYAKNIAAGATSVTATFPTSTSADVYVTEYSGVDTTNPIDVTAAAQGNSTTPNSGSVTTANANDLLFGSAALFGTPGTQGAGYTLRSTAYDNVIEDRNVSATGAYSASVSMSPAAPWVMHLVAFRAASTPTRNPLQQPFASTSIWNMPIGSGAIYTPANLPATPRSDVWAPMPQNDWNNIIFTPTAPATNVFYSSSGWSGSSRCTKTGNTLFYSVPIPANYVEPSTNQNEGAAYLMSNGRTLNMSVPFARCTANGYATSIDKAPSIDIYGDGISSGIGGSGLTGNPGGVLRVGELRPNGQGPAHALRVDVDSPQVLYACQQLSDCYRWPASKADSGAVGDYGSIGNNQNHAMRMGALLAIPASTNITTLGLETDPGKQLAWTLQNYGAYVADSTGGAGFEIVTEKGPAGSFATQFQSDYNTPLEQRVNSNTPWSRDMQRLNTALSVVDNNSATSIGGGGTPRQPLAPPIGP